MNKIILKLTILLVFCSGYLFAQIPDGYYDSAAGLQGEELKAALNDIISGHTVYPYSISGVGTGIDTWEILKESDQDPNNSENVILIYTDSSTNGDQEYNNNNGWSREHVWAKSHGFPSEDYDGYTDCHHLKPVYQPANSSRGNNDFDNGGEPSDAAPLCNRTATTWEPFDAIKGDIARIMFYMTTRYEGEEGNDPDLELVDYTGTESDTPLFGKLSTLIAWNELDPVSDFERHRNEVVFSYQGNRNPFIDHPEYVNAIYNPVSISQNNVSNISIFPNPAKGMFYVSSNSLVESVTILNILGKEVKKTVIVSNGCNVSDLPNGQYIIILNGNFGAVAKSLVISN